MADLSQILQLSQQMQGRLQQIQADLAERQVEAPAGGGMVRVKADGRGQMREGEIDPPVFEGRDADLLADLILAAVAEAQRRAAETAQAEMRKTPGLPFPPGL
jgi:DNA-binding YbaB/EbfC family protein